MIAQAQSRAPDRAGGNRDDIVDVARAGCYRPHTIWQTLPTLANAHQGGFPRSKPEFTQLLHPVAVHPVA
ncbi:unnamed protein product, partial [Nesidiocoris tenuis]